MTNEEFYKEKIYDAIVESMAVSKDGKIAICKQITCEKCIFRKKQRSVSCIAQMADWLKQEYVEQEYVEQVNWSKVKVDTPIYVRCSDDEKWVPRYFAKFEDGRVYAWSDGTTSFTTPIAGAVDWEYAKLAESEE